MQVQQILGLKHSSLDRVQEWRRLALRDAIRPDFRIYTGNDLAIDMAQYGSDYLLGLATFHPEAFAVRDRLWEERDARFYNLNDLLQVLGNVAFRWPVPAYKHSAAQFLHLRGIVSHPAPHPKAVRRPDSDMLVLATLLNHIDAFLEDVTESELYPLT
jgi:hypothetical protein